MTELKVYRDHEFARMPQKAHSTDAGYDLCSCEHHSIPPKQWRVISTGIKLDIPAGYEVQLRSRSGLAAKKGVFVLNSPATIDPDFVGEIKIILMNLGEYPFDVLPGDRIAQAVIQKVETVNIVELVDPPSKETTRGENGFGSSGVSAK